MPGARRASLAPSLGGDSRGRSMTVCVVAVCVCAFVHMHVSRGASLAHRQGGNEGTEHHGRHGDARRPRPAHGPRAGGAPASTAAVRGKACPRRAAAAAAAASADAATATAVAIKRCARGR